MSHRRFLVGLVLFGLLISLSLSPRTILAMSTEGNMAAGGNMAGYPAHYFVFDYLPGGAIQLGSYQRVNLSYPLQSLDEGQLALQLSQPQRNFSQLVVLMTDPQGNTVYRGLATFSPRLRGEFKTSDGIGIDGHFLQPQSSTFAVRLPDVPAAHLVFQDSRLHTLAEFDLPELIAQAPRLPASTSSVEVDHRLLTGSPANRVDLVIVGEGYTAAQEEEFMADAEGVASEFFSISPLSEYANYYNLYLLMAASTESGSDHPPYDASCSYWDPTCCSDPEMLGDPLQGQMVDTAFDSRFCAYGIHRLLVADDGKVMAAVGEAIPDWDQILVIVNDSTYGGSGGNIAVVSMNYAAVEVAQHEYGHSFVNLADEYESAYPGYPPCSDDPGQFLPSCEDNVTDITLREQIKWYPWILDSTPIPTPNNPAYDGLVGLFEGARYQPSGIYRSGYSCIMRSLGEPFCQVPSQSYVLTLYRGGWGAPFDGISLIEPGGTSPGAPSLCLAQPAEQAFSADTLAPVGGPPLEITWLDGGLPIPGASGATYTYPTGTVNLGLHELTMNVKDATTLVHPLMDEGLLDVETTWLVEVVAPLTMTLTASPPSIPADGSSTAVITLTLENSDGPVAGEVVTFTTTLGEVYPITATTDISGTATTVLTSATLGGTALVRAEQRCQGASVEVEFSGGPRLFIPLVKKP